MGLTQVWASLYALNMRLPVLSSHYFLGRLKDNRGIIPILPLVGIAILAVAIVVTINLLRQPQDTRSSAATRSSVLQAPATQIPPKKFSDLLK